MIFGDKKIVEKVKKKYTSINRRPCIDKKQSKPFLPVVALLQSALLFY
jgi:hypothetical protein